MAWPWAAPASSGQSLHPLLGGERCKFGDTEMAIRGDPCHVLCLLALAKSNDWVDQFRVKFLGSVQVPYHKGNDVLCAAMQKVASRCGLSLPGSREEMGSGEPSLHAAYECQGFMSLFPL